MKLSAEDYLDASRSRVNTARRLHEAGRYSAAVYFAGVSVECILRAYIVRSDPEFDARHDHGELFRQSQLESFTQEKHRREANAWLGEVWTRWKNSYRFASDTRLRSEFRRLGHSRGIKGDFLKENSRVIVEAALQLNAIGERRWKSRKS